MGVEEVVATTLLLAVVTLPATAAAYFVPKLPLSAWLVAFGFALGLGVEATGFDTGVRAGNVHSLMFFVLLPALIFEAGYSLRQDLLWQDIVPVLLMATLGVIISVFITGVALYLGIDHPGFPLVAGLIGGALLAATDPVAVVAQIRQLQAPSELVVLVEGESLFNDATAIVIFALVVSAATAAGTQTPSLGAAAVDFVTICCGGIAIGAVVGFAATTAERLLSPLLPRSFNSLLTAYGAFYIAEALCHVSGVMAVLTAALLLHRNHQKTIDAEEHQRLHTVWVALAHLFNALVFALMGLTITVNMFRERWLAMIIGIVAVLLARVIAIYGSVWLGTLITKRKLPAHYQPILVWGGLRGGVALALALSLPHDLPYWWTVQSICYGVVLFSLLVQAPTMPMLLRRFNLTSKD